MKRRVFLIATAGLAAGLFFSGLTPSPFRGEDDSAAVLAFETADLQERLENGLRSRQPHQMLFIKRVVNLVKAGQLPLKDVMGIFQWARPKRPHPFPFFQEALQRHALRKYGIVL